MLSILHPIRDQKGFVLPFVLFTVAIIMIIAASGIHIYKNNIQLTHEHIQQLKIESAFQSGLALFTQDMNNGVVPPPKATGKESEVSYSLPEGKVKILYRFATETEVSDMDKPAYRIRSRITIGDLFYSITQYVYLPDQKQE